MTAVGQNFELFQGESKEIVIPITDEDGNILDLTPYDAITWVVYDSTTKVEILRKELGSGITVSNPTTGEAVNKIYLRGINVAEVRLEGIKRATQAISGVYKNIVRLLGNNKN